MTIAPVAPDNPFSAHAERSVRGRAAPGLRPSAPAAGGAEKAIREREALLRHYKRASRARLGDAVRVEPRLGDLRRALARFSTLDDAPALVTLVQVAAQAWARHAPEDLRHLALHLVSERIQRIRIGADLAPFDDPLGSALGGGDCDGADAFRICKRALGVA